MATQTERPRQIVKIALVQMCPETLQPERNFETASKYIIDAAAQGADLAVLPEYHLTGWAPENPRFKTIAATAPTYLSRYQALAKRHNINIVPGTIVGLEPQESADDDDNTASSHLLNRTYFVSHTGEILGSYTKVNLWHPERAHLTSGAAYPPPPPHPKLPTAQPPTPTHRHHHIIHTPLGPIGLLICYDLFFPEATRALARAGARMIIMPTYTLATDASGAARGLNAACEADFARAALVARAGENTCCVVFVNPGGPAEDGFIGLSRVVLPVVGTVAGGFEGCEVGCRVVEVDMGVVDVAEENYRIRWDLAREGFHY